MRIRLLKRWSNDPFIFPMGKIMEVTRETARMKIADGSAEEYTGVYPPNEKMKTEFFKPK